MKIPRMPDPEDRPRRKTGELCSGCGRRMDENPITLSRDEITFLGILIEDFGGRIEKLAEAKLEGHIYARCSALKYFGLTEGKRGQHLVTDFGRRFYAGMEAVPRTLFMFNREIVGQAGPMVTIGDIRAMRPLNADEHLAAVRAGRRAH